MAGNIYHFYDPEFGHYLLDEDMIDEMYRNGDEPEWDLLVDE